MQSLKHDRLIRGVGNTVAKPVQVYKITNVSTITAVQNALQ